MTHDDGVALTSLSHPVERRWWKRLWLWLRHRDIDPDSLVAAEFSTDDVRHNCLTHYIIVRVAPEQFPSVELLGWPVVWSMIDGQPKFFPQPVADIEILYDALNCLPYGFRPKTTPS